MVTGFEDIDGRGGDDTFNFNSGAFGGSVEGNGGNDTFNFLGGTVTAGASGNGGDDLFTVDLDRYAAATTITPDGGNEDDADTIEVTGAGLINIDGVANTVTDGTVTVNFGNDIEALGVNAGMALVDTEVNLAGAFSIFSGGNVTWNAAITAGEVLIQGSTLFMNGDITTTGSDINLVANTSFQNSGFSLNPAGRFLVYSVDPFNDSLGGLTGSAEFGVMFPDLPSFSGNGFVYTTNLNDTLRLNQQLQNALAQLLLDGFDAQTVDDLKAFLQTEEGQKLLQGSGADKDGLENILIWLSGFDVAQN